MLWQWIIRIALWTLAGYLGSRIMKDRTPNGWGINIILGWVGGLIGNFGFLIDNEANEIVGSAPIFDNGNSLFSLALYRPNSRYDDFADLRKFIARVSPALYDDWLSFPGGVTDEMTPRLTRLKGFRFSRHKYYNLPAARLKIIEDFIQRRIAEIVDTPCRPCRSADGPSALRQKERPRP